MDDDLGSSSIILISTDSVFQQDVDVIVFGNVTAVNGYQVISGMKTQLRRIRLSSTPVELSLAGKARVTQSDDQCGTVPA